MAALIPHVVAFDASSYVQSLLFPEHFRAIRENQPGLGKRFD